MMLARGLEGCGPSQPLADGANTVFTATTERSPPGNRPAMEPAVATMIGEDLDGCGPSQPWPAANWHHFMSHGILSQLKTKKHG